MAHQLVTQNQRRNAAAASPQKAGDVRSTDARGGNGNLDLSGGRMRTRTIFHDHLARSGVDKSAHRISSIYRSAPSSLQARSAGVVD
jgi:hypothetical protein